MPFLQDGPALLMDHSRTFGLQQLMIIHHTYVGLVAFIREFYRTESFTLLQDGSSCNVEKYTKLIMESWQQELTDQS